MGYVQRAGVQATTTFSEDFSTTPTAGFPRWLNGYPSNGAGGPLFAFNGALRVTGGGTGGRPSFALPSYSGQIVAPSSMVSQYLKAKYTNTSGGVFRGGPVVMLAGRASGVAADMQGYYLQMVVDGGVANLQSIADGGPPILASILVPANNDIYEILVDISVGSNRVRVWQNGTLRADTVHSAASRPAAGGQAGFYYDNAPAGNNQNWATFETHATRT